MSSVATTEEMAKARETILGATRRKSSPVNLPNKKLPQPKRKRARYVVFVLAVLAILLARPASHHARAASLLVSFSDPNATAPQVTEARITFEGSEKGEKIPARIYTPANVKNAPGVVLVHGVHHKGIDEPRLERFARAVAGAGVVVMTPSVKELSDYKVAPRSIDTVGAAIFDLKERLGTDKVGLMGMSFGGGISLLAAADERFADDVSFVVAVGAHDDLSRVSQFFINNETPEPNGSIKKLHAHGYGMMVLVYSHASDFFPAEDVPAASDALRLWLQEKREEAKKVASTLTPPSKAKLDKLFADGPDSAKDLKPEIMAQIQKHEEDMKRVSPHGHLATIKANVYLLHGEGDTVIPSTETLWLAQDVPADRLRTALVSPAIEHVELKDPSASDKWALVHFMGQVIGEAEASR
jgi:dienelactone hydrolase